MEIWTVANQKGGVGKTTTAITLAGLLAEQGRRVLLVDMDPHGSLSAYFGHNPDQQSLSSYTLFEQRESLNPNLVLSTCKPTDLDSVRVIPASMALATLERQAIGRDGMGLVIGKALAMISSNIDVAIIDSPPLLGVLLVNAIAACEKLVIPVQTEYLALKGLERMLHTLEMMARSRKSRLQPVILPTMFDRRTQASVSSLRQLRNQYGDQVFPGKIPVDTRFRDASKMGRFPHRMNPVGHGVTDYRQFLKWFAGSAPLEQVS
ncbi:ParA family protein [Simiduia agarivorans]|uniref:ParA family protein n=1 Tax=Simiduia agarivorans (strain DSM 21679 / JCM 13881 / BCRC 17597 / SA1) TaxID=1117647 RepID=H8YHY4_SIMAS|nr:ParA family protein [Simiduia agarivorans]AFD30834.1 ParA2 [Simiduia agarivorans SA1 = DSM 21679]AFU97713.1 ParA family protein [Simiduia agarivorans SA1 = DSM 21679]